jgi:hypothetical protein
MPYRNGQDKNQSEVDGIKAYLSGDEKKNRRQHQDQNGAVNHFTLRLPFCVPPFCAMLNR